MKKTDQIKVGVTIGELGGVGPEVIIKAFSDESILASCRPVIFASSKFLAHCAKRFGVDHFDLSRVEVVPVWEEDLIPTLGKPCVAGRPHTLASLASATKALKDGEIDVLVTAPVDKKNLSLGGKEFFGHTSFLEAQLGGQALMLMVASNFRIGLLTEHVPLSKISEVATPLLLEKTIDQLRQTLIKDFALKMPRIAVLGPNPHAGDGGLIGQEEQHYQSVLKKQAENGVEGFYPADGFFGAGRDRHFDVVLAWYHDQGMIPFKMKALQRGVNFTGGLAQVRTSPSHGTAYDIAALGTACPESFKEAVRTAIAIFKKRALASKERL